MFMATAIYRRIIHKKNNIYSALMDENRTSVDV